MSRVDAPRTGVRVYLRQFKCVFMSVFLYQLTTVTIKYVLLEFIVECVCFGCLVA